MRNVLMAATAAAVVSGGGPAAGEPVGGPGPIDTHPRVSLPDEPAAVSEGEVELMGEIVVMYGDDEIVTTLGPGDYGIDISEQLPNITHRFYLHYDDDFDGIAVFTTFADLMQGGAAYSVGPGAGTMGIGYDGYNPGSYGSDGQLISVVNMNDTDNYASMDDSDKWFATTMGQEFAHSWLAHIQFRDPETSQTSSELLGRDSSHWSAVFNSGSSVMDGVAFTDNGDGSFTVGPYADRYGPLDLYAMGIIGADEVTDLYILRNARYADDNQAVDPFNDGWTGVMSPGRRVLGERVDFTIEDVIAVHGPRVPAADEENEDWRVAFVLVTSPEDSADEIAAAVDKLEVGRLTWEKKHREWSLNRSTMCTDISAPCPLAVARPEDVIISEDPDRSDGDGIIEPGERVRLQVTIANDGTEAATDAVAELSSPEAGLTLPEAETLPEVPAGGSIEHTFYAQVSGEACGAEIEVDIRSSIAHRSWRAHGSFRPGVIDAEPERFETDAGWAVNIDSRDVTVSGTWGHDVPRATYFAGRLLQPDGGAGGAGDPAWFTDPAGDWSEGELTGKSTLYSAPIDVSALHAPILRYNLWYVALDRAQTALTPSTEAHLVVEVSSDGGDTWVELDRVVAEPTRWQLREAPVPEEVDTGGELMFRFVAEDLLPVDERIVEIGIDDVAVISLSPACAGTGGGCGCRSGAGGSGAPGTGAALLALLVALHLRRRA